MKLKSQNVVEIITMAIVVLVVVVAVFMYFGDRFKNLNDLSKIVPTGSVGSVSGSSGN